MNSLRNLRAGRLARPARIFSKVGGVAAAFALAAAPFPLSAFSADAATAAAPLRYGQGLEDFYAARGHQPLWFTYGQPGPQVDALLALIDSAEVDRLDRERYRPKALSKAVRSARNGDPRAIRRADVMLSEALVNYARDLRRTGDIGVTYVDPGLRPGPRSPRAILDAAAAAPSLHNFVTRMGWMNPIYGDLRRALAARAYRSEAERRTLELNLERARELPAGPGRHVIVNVAAQTLSMHEGGRAVDSMRVVVGKAKNPTPMMAALIRFTSLNPYWNVPPDLAAERIAPFVVKHGVGYLRSKGYQVLSDWTDSATVADPSTVDWQAVAAGTAEVRIRQLPGPGNAMGRMKFMFPNADGIYLHDTPEKELLSEASRLFSGGCVRLEDAPRLGAWLFGQPLKPSGAGAEQPVPLPEPVPVYITYLTAVPDGSSIAFFNDIYGRDAARLAQLGGAPQLASTR
ncbi:L,D-transpeptidase family protein [Sphingomonas sp.]|uniref:L,D-transpeptidase family protein n=1 Tax=Sphingomonas sp. TaxID=28214 RepID=UPI00286D7339|nr:L,D-transpeptidase family protein [Sphingomonas sp.]